MKRKQLTRRIVKIAARLRGGLAAASSALGQGLDRLIYAFSPRAGARRMTFRRLWDKQRPRLASMIDGADENRHRGSSWIASRLSPDSGLEDDLETTRRNANELYLNNGFVSGYVHSLAQYVVGSGLRPRPSTPRRPAAAGELKTLFFQWARATGPDGESLTSQLTQLVKNRANDGDTLTILRVDGRNRGPIPLVLEIVPAARLETPPEHAGNVRVRMGVERGPDGQVVAYHVRRTHPGDTKETEETYDREEAFDRRGLRRVCHLIKRHWEGQTRGLPDVTPVLSAIKDLQDLTEAEIIRRQVQASVAIFVESEFDPEEMARETASETTSDGQRYEDWAPGQIMYGRVGEKPHFMAVEAGAGDTESFMAWRLRAIAAGLNWSYELLTRHYVNSFSGGQLSLIDAHQRIKSDVCELVADVLRHVWAKFVQLAVVRGLVSIEPAEYAADPVSWCGCDWLGDPLPWIQPEKAVQAEALAVGLNLDTHANALLRRNIDPDEWEEMKREELERNKRLGIPTLIPSGWMPLTDDDEADDDSEDEDTEIEEAGELAEVGA